MKFNKAYGQVMRQNLPTQRYSKHRSNNAAETLMGSVQGIIRKTPFSTYQVEQKRALERNRYGKVPAQKNTAQVTATKSKPTNRLLLGKQAGLPSDAHTYVQGRSSRPEHGWKNPAKANGWRADQASRQDERIF